MMNDRNHYNGKNCWFVEHEDGTSQQYVPYDSFGMTRFILDGFKKGKVTLNGFEIVEGYCPYQGWCFKEDNASFK